MVVAALGTPASVRAADVPTSTELSYSPAIVYRDETYTVTATVTPDPGGGTVTFRYFVPFQGYVDAQVAVGPGGIANHTMTARDDGTGGQHVEAYFHGPAGYQPSQDIFSVPVLLPPTVHIFDPPGPTQSSSISIQFETGLGNTVECRLDAGSWSACTSPFAASGLSQGTHTFQARATNDDDRTGPAASATWAVDQTGPVPGTLALGDGLTTTNRQLHTLSYPATDALSGMSTVRVSRTGAVDGQGDLAIDPNLTWSFVRLWESSGPSTPFYLDFSGSSGDQTIWVQWFDKAGNRSDIESITIDVRVARLSLGTSWQTVDPAVPIVIEGVDPAEIEGLRVSNWPDIVDGLLEDGATFASAPASWDVTAAAYGGTDEPGLHAVWAQWLDEDGSWSDVMPNAIQLVDAAVPDVVLDEGATMTADPIVWVEPVTWGRAMGWAPRLEYSCDGTDWSAVDADLQVVAISVADEGAGCTSANGLRSMKFRWTYQYGPYSTIRTVPMNLQRDPSLPSNDASAPAGAVEIAGGAVATTASSVTLAVPATDSQTAVTNVRLSNDGTSWTTRTYSATQPWTLASGNGVRTVWASWRDAANNWTAPVLDTVIVDTVKPTVSSIKILPAQGQQAGSTGSLPVVVQWSASGTGSGVKRFEAAMRTDSGTWTTVSTNLTATSFKRTLAGGHAYRFRVRAVDQAGNVGSWVESVTVRRYLVNSGSSAITYSGSWTTASTSSAIGGTERRSSQAGATAKVSILGRGVAWVASVCSGCGKANVYVDGVLKATVDLQSSSTIARRLVWSTSWSSVGSHTIRIKVLGTSGRPRVGVDAFLLLR
jgi:hypothetical protein